MARTRPDGAARQGLVASLVALAAFVAVAAATLRGAPSGPPPPLEEPLESPPAWLAALDRVQRRHPAVAFVVAVAKKFGEDRAGYLAALVSYFAFFSVFPLLMALTSVLGMVLEGDEELAAEIADAASEQIPLVGGDLGVGTLTGSTAAVVAGAAVALWSGMRVIDAAQNALNDVWDVPMAERPGLLTRRLRSFLLLGVIGLSLFASIVAASLLNLLPGLPGGGVAALYAVSVLVNFGIFLLAFQLLSGVDHRWGELVPGSAFAAVGWFVVNVPGTLYIQQVVNRSEEVYANFATVIGLLTFFFALSQVVIIGAEINAVHARRLWPRSLLARYGELTEADERAYVDAAAATSRLPSRYVELRFRRGPGRRR